jgi:hypothetical protein
MSKLTKSKEEAHARANTINVLVTQFGVKEHEIKHLPLGQLKWMLNARRYEADKLDEPENELVRDGGQFGMGA